MELLEGEEATTTPPAPPAEVAEEQEVIEEESPKPPISWPSTIELGFIEWGEKEQMPTPPHALPPDWKSEDEEETLPNSGSMELLTDEEVAEEEAETVQPEPVAEVAEEEATPPAPEEVVAVEETEEVQPEPVAEVAEEEATPPAPEEVAAVEETEEVQPEPVAEVAEEEATPPAPEEVVAEEEVEEVQLVPAPVEVVEEEATPPAPEEVVTEEEVEEVQLVPAPVEVVEEEATPQVSDNYGQQQSWLNSIPMERDEGHFCSYAGYVSVIGADKESCLPPWELSVQSFRKLGKLYVEYNTCGVNNVVRCNPVLYGYREEHEGNPLCLKGKGDRGGCCVKVFDERDHMEVTNACNMAFAEDDSLGLSEEVVRGIALDPERLAHYLVTSLATIKECPLNESTCIERRNSLRTIMQEMISGLDESDEFGHEEFNSTLLYYPGVHNFETALKELEIQKFNQLTADAFGLHQKRREILRDIAERMESDERTSSIVQKAWEVGRRSRGGGKCYRGVKDIYRGQGNKNGYLVNWYSDNSAKDAIYGLSVKAKYFTVKGYSFIDIAKCGHPLDAEEAMVGSAVVYLPTPSGRGRVSSHGHIEVVGYDETGVRMYYSDYHAPAPISYSNSYRRTIGIMLPVTDEEKERIEELCYSEEGYSTTSFYPFPSEGYLLWQRDL